MSEPCFALAEAQPLAGVDQQAESEVTPSVITLALSPTFSMETEVIQWDDGKLSIPVKAFSALFGIDIQQSDADGRLLFVDSQTGKKVEINWLQQKITANGLELPIGDKPITRSQRGFLLADDVYLEQSAFTALFGVTFFLDTDTTSLTLSTSRKLKLPASAAMERTVADWSNVQLIRTPDIHRSLVSKAFVQQNSSYGLQDSRQPINARVQRTQFNSLVDNSTMGVSGNILGVDYIIKPSITRFNNKFNLQSLDWQFQKEIKNSVVSLGSTDAGLSPLTSPNLPVWGLRIASKNATSPLLTPSGSYEFFGPAQSGNKVSLKLNQRTVQTVTAQADHYDLDPVYLQGQTINDIQVVELDAQNHEKILTEKKIGYFPNMLPRGEIGYSAFAGRAPLQFYPLLPNQKTPVFMPQTEKWLAGGRFFYGVTNRLTVGLATAADHNFGKPETYYNNLNPLAIDLTGFSSYLRDPNFFSGQNVSASARYQLSDRWMVSTDVGVGRYGMNSGSRLPVDSTGFGKAGKIRLEGQGRIFSWYMDAFHYDPNYYTPAISLYGNAFYDKQGVSSGVSGGFSRKLPVQYNLNWSRYQTNLQRNIPGGVILANHWYGSINTQLSQNNLLMLNYSIINGDNRVRDLLQRNLSATFRTQNLPWRLQGDIRASHYYSNTVFQPSPQNGTNLTQFDYLNNSIDSSLDIPFDKKRNQHIRLGHRWSNFVDYGSVRGYFQYKDIFLEPYIQLSYGNKPQKQDQMGIRLGYQFKSGARINVSYYRLTSAFSLSGLGGGSQISTNQFFLDFSDVFGLLPNRLQSLGPSGETQGIISGTVFADAQTDGKYNPKEPGVKDVQILVDGDKVITTNRRGQYSIIGLSAGYHTLEILPDNLPLTLGADNPTYKIKIKEGKIHRVNIALTPEGGILSGRLNLTDVKGILINPKNIVLVLINEKGSTVKYTEIDEQGEYRFSNIASGKYTIALEDKIKNSGRYKIITQPEPVELPVSNNYERLTEIKKLNFHLISL